uniref:hypothetical protein n=1 Tax=Nonomuraea montanisoli TaxID=2741721 RepID=UPI0038B40F3A
MTAIHATNLTKRYGRTVAVADLSFDVEPGRVTGFLGPNGAGKPVSGLGHLRFGNDAQACGRVSIMAVTCWDSQT